MRQFYLKAQGKFIRCDLDWAGDEELVCELVDKWKDTSKYRDITAGDDYFPRQDAQDVSSRLGADVELWSLTSSGDAPPRHELLDVVHPDGTWTEADRDMNRQYRSMEAYLALLNADITLEDE